MTDQIKQFIEKWITRYLRADATADLNALLLTAAEEAFDAGSAYGQEFTIHCDTGGNVKITTPDKQEYLKKYKTDE